MNTVIQILLLPFKLIWLIVWKIFWIDNFVLISKNTTTIYKILKGMNLELSEKQYWLYAGITDAYSYIFRFWYISVEDIYNICKSNDDYEWFLFDFIKLLLDCTNPELASSAYSSFHNKQIIKDKIKIGMQKSKAENSLYIDAIPNVLEIEEIKAYTF